VFDTGIITDFLVGGKKSKLFFEEHVFSGEVTPVISAQTVAELFMAARNKKEEAELDQWVSSLFDIADLDYATAKQAGLLKRGKSARTGDMIVASAAKSLGIPLVTTIPEAYKGTEVKLFKPY
jgi:predicted nucleic acid-binding protein